MSKLKWNLRVVSVDLRSKEKTSIQSTISKSCKCCSNKTALRFSNRLWRNFRDLSKKSKISSKKRNSIWRTELKLLRKSEIS